jgi:hypothetical protein
MSETIPVRFDVLQAYAQTHRLDFNELCRVVRDAIAEGSVQAKAPVDMVLFCPRCGTQHVDAPEDVDLFRSTMLQIGGLRETNPKPWTNPPHKSHLCHTCGCIWRPADVPTNGVERTKTRGANDSAMGVRNHAVETWTDIDGNLYAGGPDGEEVLLRRRAPSSSGLDRTKGAM